MLVATGAALRLALTAVVLGSALATTACSAPEGPVPEAAPTAAASSTPSATATGRPTPATPGSSPTATSAAPTSSPTSSPTTSPTMTRSSPTRSSAAPSPTGSPTAAEAPDPEAPASPTPVARASTGSGDRLPAVRGSLDDTLRWSDGLRLQVRDVENAVLEAKGPGSVNGPVTSFSLRLTNGSDAPVDVTQVVATLAYGRSTPRLATPVYDDRAADFGTRLAPGASATARYSFAVPRSGRSAVTLTVDLDARHGLATFQGDAG